MTYPPVRPEVEGDPDLTQAKRVLANPRFLALFLSQILTQVGGNMVLFGLTLQVYVLTGGSNTSVSLLLLTFLVPAVVFGAIAGVFVDRYDRRTILVSTNIARGLLFLLLVFFDDRVVLVYGVTALVATLSTFFAPAESALIPIVVERKQLLAANGIFIFALQASFVLGFAVLGPLLNSLVKIHALLATVSVFYLLAAGMCLLLPAAPPAAREVLLGGALDQAKQAIRATGSQLREGLVYIRRNHNIFWSLAYLAITASLIGVLGVLGPDFAVKVLGLTKDDFVIIVLPLGAGLVLGILLLNAYGKYVTRRRLIEGGLAALAISLLILGGAQRVTFPADGTGLGSLLGVVIAVAFSAGVSYAFVAVPSQTALQEELPEEVRGRVFGVLNMLVSMASFLPILVVGPVADLIDTSTDPPIGTSTVILVSAAVIAVTAIGSFLFAKRLGGSRGGPGAPGSHLEPVDPMTVTSSSNLTRPIKLGYPDEAPDEENTEIDYHAAVSVVPGRSGPAPVGSTDGPAAG